MVNRERNILGITTASTLGGTIEPGDTAQLVSSIDATISGNTEEGKWDQFITDIDYFVEDDAAIPDMANIIISAGNYWNQPTSTDYGYSLTVDDITLLYYSRITDLAYDGKAMTLAQADDEFTYNIDCFIEDLALDRLSWELVGQGRTATVSEPVIDSDNNRIIITVSNVNGVDRDGLSEHTYILKCKNPEITAITIGGSGRALDEAVINYAGYYNPETTAVDAVVKGPAEKVITYDEVTSTVTVTYTRTDQPLEGETMPDPQVFTIRFWKPVATVEFPEDMPEELMTDDTPLTIDLNKLSVSPADAHDINKLYAKLFNADGEELGSDFSNTANYAEASTGSDGIVTVTGRHPGDLVIKMMHPDFEGQVFAEKTVTVKATPIESITVKKGQETVHVLNGRSKTISVDDYLEITPENAYCKDITWDLPDVNAVFITTESPSEVTLKGSEESETLVTLTAISVANPDIRAEIAVKVDGAPVAPERILWDNEDLISGGIYYLGEVKGTKRLTYHFNNTGVNIVPIVSWTSEPEGYVDSKGVITVPADSDPVEKVTITLTIDWDESEGKAISRNYEFEVRQPVTALKWTDEDGNAITVLDFKQHESPAVTAVIAPENASDKTVNYTSSDETVAVYDAEAGKIVAKGFGEAVITASATNDATETNGRTPVEAALKVTIAAMPTEITINETENGRYWVGKHYQMTAEITPDEASAAQIYWTSDNSKVALIDYHTGEMTVRANGTATITATAENGVTASATIKAVTYTGVKRMVGGWFIITDAQGNEEIIESAIDTETTSPTDITLTATNMIVKGMRLGDISASFEFSSDVEDADGNPTDINFLPSTENEVTVMKGAITALVSIPSGSDGVTMGNIDFSKRTPSADILFSITVPDWDNEKATAIFTTVKPAGGSEPEQPTVPAGTIVKYPGKMIFEVAADPSDENTGTESYTIKAVVTVTDKGETTTDETGNTVSVVTVDIPAIRFGEVKYDDWSRSADKTEYRYNIPAMTLPDVIAKTTGSVTSYIREENDLEVTDEDGNTNYYVVGLRGTASESGDARFSLTFRDPASEESIGGSFANSEDEGDIYSGFLSIEMMGEMVAEDQPATVNIIPSDDGLSATFLLPNFTLEGFGSLGDIRVDDVKVERQDDGSVNYTGSVAGMELMDGDITADVDLTGTVDAEGNASMIIAVNWQGIDIYVEFTGERTGSATTATPGITVPSVPVAGSDAPVELFNLNGIRVNPATALPGIYIERRGTIVRKVIR